MFVYHRTSLINFGSVHEEAAFYTAQFFIYLKFEGLSSIAIFLLVFNVPEYILDAIHYFKEKT